MGRARADPGAPDGGPRSPPEGKSRAGHSHGQLASPFLTSSICPNSNEQNSPAQHSSPSIRHAKLLNASECGSKGCLWSGSCLPGGEAGGADASVAGCHLPQHRPPHKDSKLPGVFRGHWASHLLWARGPYPRTAACRPVPSPCGSPPPGSLEWAETVSENGLPRS